MRAATAVLLCGLLAACSDMTQPEDIKVAEEMCASRGGGYKNVARYRHGANLLISCKDGTYIDIHLPKGGA